MTTAVGCRATSRSGNERERKSFSRRKLGIKSEHPTVQNRWYLPRPSAFAAELRRAVGRSEWAQMAVPHGAQMLEPTMQRVKVAVCVQPFETRNSDFNNSSSRPTSNVSAVRSLGGGRLAVSDAKSWNAEEFAVDYVYGAVEASDVASSGASETHDAAEHEPTHVNTKLWQDVGAPALDAAWAGHNVGVVAVGHTGSGRKHAMRGDSLGSDNDINRNNYNSDTRGLVPRFVEALFGRIDEQKSNGSNGEARVELVATAVHNERCKDLLRDRVNAISPTTGQSTAVRVNSLEQMNSLLKDAYDALERKNISQNSHVVCRLHLTRFTEKVPVKESAVTRAGALTAAHAAPTVSVVTFVEVVGLERKGMDGSLEDFCATVEVLAKTPKNLLGKKLSDASTGYGQTTGKQSDASATGYVKTIDFSALDPPKYQSSLCGLLKDTVLGGVCTTFVVAAVTPFDKNVTQTLDTLRLASLFRKVKQVSIRNKDHDALSFIESEVEVKHLTKEIENLVEQLALVRARSAKIPSTPTWGVGFKKTPTKKPLGTEKNRALTALRNRPRTPVKTPENSREDEASPSVDDDSLALRSRLRDARLKMEHAERRFRNARTRWTVKVEAYHGNGKTITIKEGPGVGAEGHTRDGTSSLYSGSSRSILEDTSSRPTLPTFEPLRRGRPSYESYESYESSYPVIPVPEIGARPVTIGTDANTCDVVLTGFMIRPMHWVVRVDSNGETTVTAADDDADADVWVNGVRVPSKKDAEAFGTKLHPLRNGDRVVIGAVSQVAYVFQDPSSASFSGVTDTKGGSSVNTNTFSSDTWLEAQSELKPRAATLARALAAAPSSPPFDPESDINDMNANLSTQITQPGERRRKWREACRRKIASVLPDVDEANLTFKMLNLTCRVSCAWRHVDVSDTVHPSDGAPVCVVLRNTKSLSPAQIAKLESETSAVDDFSNAAARWEVFDFSGRLKKLKTLREEFFRNPNHSLGISYRVSVENEHEDPFLTIDEVDGNSEVVLRFIDVAPQTVDAKFVKKGLEKKTQPPRASDANFEDDFGDDSEEIVVEERDKDNSRITQDDSSSSSDELPGPDSFLRSANAQRPVGKVASEVYQRTVEAKSISREVSLSPQNTSQRPTTSDPDTVTALSNALETERKTITVLEQRLITAEENARKAKAAVTSNVTKYVRRTEKLSAEIREVQNLADERVSEAERGFEKEKKDLETALERTKDARSKAVETEKARATQLELELKTLREKIENQEEKINPFETLSSKVYDDTPGVAPFSFPKIPTELLKPVPGESKSVVIDTLRELLTQVNTVSKSVQHHLEYTKTSLERVRTECASARADKADEIARRVAIEYFIGERDEEIERLKIALQKTEKTSTAMAVANARAISEGNTPNQIFKTKTVFDTNAVKRRDDMSYDSINRPMPALNMSRVKPFDSENVRPSDAQPLLKRNGQESHQHKSPPAWAKSSRPLLSVAQSSLDGSAHESNSNYSRMTQGIDRSEQFDSQDDDSIRVPAILTELTDFAMSLPLSASRAQSRAATPVKDSLQNPRRGVASRVKEKLGNRVRSAANSNTNSPDPSPSENDTPPSGGRAREWFEVDLEGNTPKTPEYNSSANKARPVQSLSRDTQPVSLERRMTEATSPSKSETKQMHGSNPRVWNKLLVNPVVSESDEDLKLENDEPMIDGQRSFVIASTALSPSVKIKARPRDGGLGDTLVDDSFKVALDNTADKTAGDTKKTPVKSPTLRGMRSFIQSFQRMKNSPNK